MTFRQAYEFALIECNKLKAPAMLLEDYIYLFNKAVQQYINTVYNRCDYNQQSTDDLMFLQTTCEVKPMKPAPRKEFGNTIYEYVLPKDYLHILNCIAQFTGPGKTNCDTEGKLITSPCQKLTSNMYPGILNNHYMKPSHKKPYFNIKNEHAAKLNDKPSGDELKGNNDANRLPVILEVHCGQTRHTLQTVQVTYLKAPKYYTMTQEDLMRFEDETQVLEFPDYICYEILNVYIRLLLEQSGDPRLSTHIPINQTIGVSDNN